DPVGPVARTTAGRARPDADAPWRRSGRGVLAPEGGPEIAGGVGPRAPPPGRPRRSHRSLWLPWMPPVVGHALRAETLRSLGLRPAVCHCLVGCAYLVCSRGFAAPLRLGAAMAAATSMGHIQRPDPLRAQLGCRLATDLSPLRVLERPLAAP